MEAKNLNEKENPIVVDSDNSEITHESPKLRGVYSEFMSQIEARENPKSEKVVIENLDEPKESFKVNIVDISKKKDTKTKNNFIKEKFENFEKKEAQVLFDSLIYVGGGLIAFASVTSKNLSDLGTFLINKK